MRARAEVDITAVELGQFGYPQPGAQQDEEHGVVAAAGPAAAVAAAASRAVLSAAVSQVTRVVLVRLPAMARTRWMTAACSGACRAAYRNSEWIAARRALRVRALLRR